MHVIDPYVNVLLSLSLSFVLSTPTPSSAMHMVCVTYRRGEFLTAVWHHTGTLVKVLSFWDSAHNHPPAHAEPYGIQEAA
jgi:hypothetical protein